MAEPAGKDQIRALTGIRFFAAFSVMTAHFTSWIPLVEPPEGRSVWHHVLYTWVDLGGEPVSLFYVLSGFILAYNYVDANARGMVPARPFYVARIARIAPAYLACFLIAGPLFIATGGDPQHSFAYSALRALTLTQTWDTDAVYWNGPSWTLSNEAFFYLLFPLVMLALTRLGPRMLMVSALVWYAATFSGLYALRHGWMSYGAALQNPTVRLPEFVLGMTAGLLFVTGYGRAVLRRVPVALVLAGLVIALIATNRLPYELRHNGLLAPIFVVLLLRLAVDERSWLARGLAHPALVLLGEASYALYLLHVPLRDLMRYFTGWSTGDTAAACAIYLLFSVLAVGASVAMYLAVDRPGRRLIRRALLPAQHPTRLAGEDEPRRRYGTPEDARAVGAPSPPGL